MARSASTARPSGGNVRGPYAKTAARREQILQTALEAFAVRGFRASSLREIAEQVGLSQAGILHHFSSKEALLTEVLLQRDAVSEGILHDKTEGLELLGALRDVMAYNIGQPGLVRLFTTLSAEATDADHPAHDYFVLRYSTVRQVISHALAEAQKRGEISAEADVMREAAAIIAMQDGLQVQWLLDPSFDMLAAFDGYMDKLLKGLGVPKRLTRAIFTTETRLSATS
jgi:AcrR family transcriptional regulator